MQACSHTLLHPCIQIALSSFPDTFPGTCSLLPFADTVESAMKFFAHHIKHRRKCDKVFIEQARLIDPADVHAQPASEADDDEDDAAA